MKINFNQNGWSVSKLEDIATKITKGGTPTTYGFPFQKNGINFIKVENIKNGSVLCNTITDYISEEAHIFQAKSQLSVNDILFSIAGTIGETCVVKKEYLPANTNQALAIIKGTECAIEPKLLNFQLEAFVAKIKLKARGGAMNNVSLDDLKKLLVYIPPLAEQHRIVAKIEELFSSLDKGIESLKAAQAQLKTYRHAVLKWAFVDSDNTTTIGDEFDFIGGGTPSKDKPEYWNGDLNWCSVKDVKGDYLNCTIDKISELGLKESAANLAEPNDVILITRISPGKTIINKIRTAINQDLKVIKPKRNYNPLFIHYLFQAFERKIIKLSSGTTVLGINLSNLKSIPVPFVSLPEQARIVAEIEKRLSVCDKMEESITRGLLQAEALRQSILKKAFEGRLVPQDPADEPAAVLLERIRSEREKEKVAAVAGATAKSGGKKARSNKDE